MPSTNYGTLTTAPKNVKIRFTSQSSNGTSSVNTGGTCVQEFDVEWNSAAAFIPAQFTPLPSPYENFFLIDSLQEMTPAGMAHIVLTYQASYYGTPPTQYTEQNGSMDVPITEHTDFDTWDSNGWVLYDDNGQFLGFTQESGLYGVESFIAATSIVTVKAYFTSEPTDLRGNIGTTQNPGRDYEGDANWLIIGSSRALEGYFWSQVTTYRWSATAWNSLIYDAA